MTFRNVIETVRSPGFGATTVDWVVLASACLGLAMAGFSTITGALDPGREHASGDPAPLDAARAALAQAGVREHGADL